MLDQSPKSRYRVAADWFRERVWAPPRSGSDYFARLYEHVEASAPREAPGG